MKKKVIFISFGHGRKPYYPEKPQKGVYQWILDVRFLYEPYSDGHESSGLEKYISELVLEANKPFFKALEHGLEEAIKLFLANKEYQTFQIYFGCYGGWQRSVAAAEYFKKWLEKKQPKLSVASQHISIEMQEI